MILLPALYSEKYGISLASIGIIIFCAKIIDIVTDPLMGWVNDLALLKRKQWMFIGAIISGVSLYCILIPVSNPNEIYLSIFIVSLYTGWTIFQVPYLSFGYDLEKDYNGRTSLSATREFFILFGLIASVSLPLIIDSNIPLETSITFLAIVSGSLGISLFFFTVKEPKKLSLSKKKDFGTIMHNSIFMRLSLSWFINCLANVFPTVLFVFFVTYVIGGSEEDREKILFYYFLAAFLGMPFWVWLSRYVEKKNIWFLSMISSAIFFSFVFFLNEGDINLFIIISVLTGFCLGADLSIPPSIQSDLVDYHKSIYYVDISGLFFSFLTFMNKFAFGIASVVSFTLLESFGFQEGQSLSKTGSNLLYVLYAGVPIVLKLIASFLIWYFPLSKKESESISKKLYIK
tara:strand:+ start:27766 stop:28971 length:1206 start_codon:yes stop_codon:yes gene_type:complete